jgi:hypothetical protein
MNPYSPSQTMAEPHPWPKRWGMTLVLVSVFSFSAGGGTGFFVGHRLGWIDCSQREYGDDNHPVRVDMLPGTLNATKR